GLAVELRQAGVSVLAVAPGPTSTPFWKTSTNRFVPFTNPDRVAQVALRRLGRGSMVTVGWLNCPIVFSTRLLPRSWNVRIFGAVLRFLNGTKAKSDSNASSELQGRNAAK